ncbi:hypothetical protein JOC78_002255 [Bacillus ectoiniformans]|nr:hypothetical protein [Bacillus ectoiniformans]MBM7649302.1 hypothetical protein [Bacillus ectoiniformans]
MRGNKTLLTTAALGAAFLLRNGKSRDKLMKQFQSLGSSNKKNK